MIKLSPRLSACAMLAKKGGFALDIGTDHALLPCFLVMSGVSRGACAADIAEGPLLAAKKTVSLCGLGDKVSAVLSDGLKNIPDDILAKTTDIFIAGMGGELIAEILSSERVPPSASFILQPNTRAPMLRAFLAERGFATVSERAVRDGKFLYPVILARLGAPSRKLSELEAEVGSLDPRDPESLEYLRGEKRRLILAGEGMAASEDREKREEAERVLALAKKIEEYISGGVNQ